jgi:hypothetical protein
MFGEERQQTLTDFHAFERRGRIAAAIDGDAATASLWPIDLA